MIKFKTFDASQQPEKTVYFRVVDFCDCPTLAACSEDGKVLSYIAGINESGELYLCNGIHSDLGLSLNDDGQIKARIGL